MSSAAIKVEGLGKRYRIRTETGYRTLRDALSSAARAAVRLLRHSGETAAAETGRAVVPALGVGGEARDWVWAVKDVDFELSHGQVLGVVGRNGAGKSTLLKILSRVTEPTEGRVEIRGRLGSLLEVGTGFHPELTGRENIYLNGAIIGMKRLEITQKFDEIVAFAEIERFLDTPVKHYSSGMYVRLAFAVAAHLEPEILLVDEVLAVGDAAFQKKCLGKMGDVARGGRTVVLVTHNVVAVEHLCTSAILLDGGRLVKRGSPQQVVEEYLTRSGAVGARADLKSVRRRWGSGEIRFAGVDVLATDGSGGAVIRSGDGVILRVHFEARARVVRPVFSVAIANLSGLILFAVHTSDLNVEIPELERDGSIELEIARLNLMPGKYLLHFAVGDEVNPHRYDHLVDAAELDVEPADVYGSGKVRSSSWSLVFFDCKWRVGDLAGSGGDGV